MRKYVIERDIPRAGALAPELLRGAAKASDAPAELAPDIRWVASYVVHHKTFCIYLARDEAVIRRHAEISGFPAARVTEVKPVVDPAIRLG